MSKNHQNIPQFSLILRLFCAGYLLYTAWDLRDAFQDGIHFVIFAAVFVVVGLVLGVHSILKLVRKEYTTGNSLISTKEDEEIKDCEEQSDE